jgi:ACT domain-containing protein
LPAFPAVAAPRVAIECAYAIEITKDFQETAMPESVRRIDYFTLSIPDKVGEGARVLKQLQEAGVNLLAFSAFPRARRAQADFIPEDSAKFRSAAKKLGLQLSERKIGFLLQGEDRVGALTETLDKLAQAQINLTAMDAVASGEGRYGAIFWVKPENVNKAAKALGIK